MTVRTVYLDCEFLPAEPGTPGLVSLALTDGVGRDYYAVNADADPAALLGAPWVAEHVLPHLPYVVHRGPAGAPRTLGWDTEHPDYPALKPAGRIRDEVAAYFADDGGADATHLYAYYGARDLTHLHALWDGDWQAMPAAVPRWYVDLKALAVLAGAEDAAAEPEPLGHHALEDARHCRTLHRRLTPPA
ncbi:hypothetical protein [Streptomyces sp. URMC 123]|uniref:hypothetical protein n=1 Tax=Streptomyces sp. URMC 123 TaxID=3423403 RepID=UPI003F19F07B